MEDAMSSLTDEFPELDAPARDPADAAEAARCVENAADTVHKFASESAAAALDALISAAEDPAAGHNGARGLATTVTAQAATLHAEVARFLTDTGST